MDKIATFFVFLSIIFICFGCNPKQTLTNSYSNKELIEITLWQIKDFNNLENNPKINFSIKNISDHDLHLSNPQYFYNTLTILNKEGKTISSIKVKPILSKLREPININKNELQSFTLNKTLQELYHSLEKGQYSLYLTYFITEYDVKKNIMTDTTIQVKRSNIIHFLIK